MDTYIGNMANFGSIYSPPHPLLPSTNHFVPTWSSKALLPHPPYSDHLALSKRQASSFASLALQLKGKCHLTWTFKGSHPPYFNILVILFGDKKNIIYKPDIILSTSLLLYTGPRLYYYQWQNTCINLGPLL